MHIHYLPLWHAEWDATHPRWKNTTETVVNDKFFDKPVIKESSLKYPPFVSPGERRVMIAANASDGLDEFFAENLLNPVNKYLRWQRFVSNTGMTRMFPGTYDDASYDNRLAPWYKMATQPPKRVIFLLDLSGSMLFEGKIEIAKTAIITLLNTLIVEDYVNVLFIDDTQTVPQCFSEYLVPATASNIKELIRFVEAATVGAADKLTGAFSKVDEILQETDRLVTRAEKFRTPEYLSKAERSDMTAAESEMSEKACRNNKCTPVHEYVMLVSDGEFILDSKILQQFSDMAERRPLLHTITIAVGKMVNKDHMIRISCAMNGLYFNIVPLSEDADWAQHDSM